VYGLGVDLEALLMQLEQHTSQVILNCLEDASSTWMELSIFFCDKNRLVCSFGGVHPLIHLLEAFLPSDMVEIQKIQLPTGGTDGESILTKMVNGMDCLLLLFD